MSAELSILLARLFKEAASVAGSGRTNAPQVAEVLERRSAPVSGESQPDYLSFQLGLVDLLEAELANTQGLDESLVDELDDDREQLAERNAAAVELTGKLNAVQAASRGLFGQSDSRKLFSYVETLPQDPVQLGILGQRVRRRLEDPAYPLPAGQLEGVEITSRQSLADDLGTSVDRFNRALETLGGERKTSDNRRFVKREAFDRFRLTVRHVAGCLAGLYGLAGFDELAAKIRPKRRRRRGSGPEGEPEEQATSPASEASPEAPPEAEQAAPPRPTLVKS